MYLKDVFGDFKVLLNKEGIIEDLGL